jgi:hypothetical protein
VTWPLVQIVTLDEQKRQRGGVPNPPDLGPKPTPRKRAVKIRDRLPLDENASENAVVARRQGLDHDASAEPLQTRRDTAPVLEHICGDDHIGSFTHGRSLLWQQDGRVATKLMSMML